MLAVVLYNSALHRIHTDVRNLITRFSALTPLVW